MTKLLTSSTGAKGLSTIKSTFFLPKVEEQDRECFGNTEQGQIE
jgi:hypothetical protein